MAVGIQAGSANNRQAHLANAYQELGNELSSTNCKVVGGYTLGRVIGEVFLATHRLTGTRCAVKRIPKSHTSQVTREIHHHRRLHHLHIVQLYEIIATETHVWLVTELCSGGELFDYLVEKGRMLEGEARRLFGELAVAVGHMHKEGVVHRDLKLENVLLDGELRIKLGDLGFAREWAKGKLMETFCGTTGYASPEMLSGKKYLGVETDLWSMGIILYILLCGGLPFDDDDERVMKDLILAGIYDEPEWLSERTSEHAGLAYLAAARDLISQLLRQDPQARLSIEGILNHPWFSMTITDVPPQQPLSVPSSPQPDAGPGNGILVSPGPATADIKRIHSGEFSHTEKALEAMHDRSISFAPTTTSDDSNSLQLPLASSSRTPSRTKRRSVSSTMSLERRASTHAGTTYLPVDYAAMLKEERTALFTTKEEKKLLDRLAAVYVDTGQLIHSVETHACDSSSAMWWLLRAKQMDEVDTAPRRRETRRRDDQFSDKSREQTEPTVRSEKLPLAQPAPRHHLSPGIEPQISRGPSPTEIRPTDVTPKAKPAALTIPIATPKETPSTPTREPNTISLDGSPKHGLKTRSPSMSMLQRATSAFLGKSADDETGHSPTKLQKAPPLPTVNLAERPLDRNKDEKKRESMWTSWSSFRQFFNDGNYRKKRPDMALSSRDKPTLVLSRGIAARAPHGRRVPSGQVAAARRTSVDRPVYSRRSSSVNSRRSSISMVEPVRLTGADGIPLYRRTSHRSHGSQTPTSDREFDFPSRPDSATSLRRRDSQRSGISAMRSPSMQSDSSFNRRVPISPLHNYQRRPPQGTASTRIRHIRVIPESQLLRSNSVASSIRSNPSSRASSIHEDDDSVHNLSSGSGGHTHHAHNRRRKDSESLARQIHRRSSPLVPHTYGSSANPHSYRSKPRKPKTHLRDVFQKDDEWIDEDQYRYAGGLGQGGSNGTAPRAETLGGSMASSAWIDGRRTALNTLGAKRHKSGSTPHAHATAPTLGQPVGRKSSGSDSSPDSTTQVSSSGNVGASGNQRRGIPTGRAQPAIIQEEEEEEE